MSARIENVTAPIAKEIVAKSGVQIATTFVSSDPSEHLRTALLRLTELHQEAVERTSD